MSPSPSSTTSHRARPRKHAKVLGAGVAAAALVTLARTSSAEGPGEPGAFSYLAARAGLETSLYADSDATVVFTPVVLGEVTNPVSAWKVNGSFLVDVVSTASADVVAGASPRWREERYAGTLSGSKRFDDVEASLRGSLSSEPDYLSASGGVSLSLWLFDRRFTPHLAYDFTHATIGRSGTSFDVFSHTLTKHAVDAGLEIVVDGSTLLVPMLTTVVEQGDSSKPYRFVPLFTPETELAPGAPASEEAPRLGKVVEKLPDSRLRFALMLRLLHRFTRSTLRADERLYADTWGVKATTTDLRYLIDVRPRVRIGPHLRLHAQSGAAFYQRFYTASGTSADLNVPTYRTGDRELGPLLAATLGASTRFAFGEWFSLTPSVDGIYTRFLDALLIKNRVGVLGTVAFEAEFE